MQKTILQLKTIVSSNSAEEAEREIADLYPRLSPRAARNVRKDVQEHLDGEMPESMLSYYLAEAGL